MNRTFLYGFAALLCACTGSETINCVEMPGERACQEACQMDPTLTYCTTADAGPDTGTPDGNVDAGPDVPASNCTTPCEGDTAICDEDNSVCVQCLAPMDCEGVDGRPMCISNACVECTTNADCSEPGASVCFTDGMSDGTCVGCAAGNTDDCTGIVDGDANDLNVCDESGESPVCVECNAGDESACEPSVCDVLAKVCTDIPANMTPTCGTCVSDSQCAVGQTCAPTTFEGMDAGYYCLWNLDAPETVACSGVFPVGTPEDVTTIGDDEAEVCTLTLSTCPAYNDFRSPGRGAPSCAGKTRPKPTRTVATRTWMMGTVSSWTPSVTAAPPAAPVPMTACLTASSTAARWRHLGSATLRSKCSFS